MHAAVYVVCIHSGIIFYVVYDSAHVGLGQPPPPYPFTSHLLVYS